MRREEGGEKRGREGACSRQNALDIIHRNFSAKKMETSYLPSIFALLSPVLVAVLMNWIWEKECPFHALQQIHLCQGLPLKRELRVRGPGSPGWQLAERAAVAGRVVLQREDGVW